MAAGKGLNGPSIIIKRVEASSDGGHHGGAWKVAYADFVTAMMAFFLLMWLLNATTEEQKTGLADYFAPTVIQTPNATTSGGGDGTEDGVRHAVEAPLPDSDSAGDFEEVARAVVDRLPQAGVRAGARLDAGERVCHRGRRQRGHRREPDRPQRPARRPGSRPGGDRAPSGVGRASSRARRT